MSLPRRSSSRPDEVRITAAGTAIVISIVCSGCAFDRSVNAGRREATFTAASAAEAVATLTADCARCEWDVPGREAVMLRITLDGQYSQHLPIVRQGLAGYRLMLGRIAPGAHVVNAAIDPQLSAADLRATDVAVESIAVDQIDAARPEYTAVAFAPFLYARANTVGRFTDTPVFMWSEREPTARGTKYRYSVIFTNEDGGTPADRLMATWGRTTDIEYIYSVEIDASTTILAQDFQGPDHEVLPFNGQREAEHPLLWVATDNNMVRDTGTTAIRFAPAAVPFDLTSVSREVVMDANPWMYALSAKELAREGKIEADAPPGNGKIPDERRFLFLEGCGQAGNAGITFGVRTGASTWHWADRGKDYLIARDGCFRGAVPLPAGTSLTDVTAVAFRALPRSGRTADAPAHLTRVNRLFMLDDKFLPGQSLLTWQGSADLAVGGPPFEIPVK
jgi:hypothetical protein